MTFERAAQPENVEGREASLDRKLHELQMRFADRKWREGGGKATFVETLDGVSTLVSDAQAQAHMADDPERAGAAWQETAARIEDLHAEGAPGWAKEAAGLLEEWTKDAPDPLADLESAGFLKFGLKTGETDLEAYGIGPKDQVVEIHVTEAFRVPGASLTPQGFRDAFGALAERMAKEYPQAKAVVGQSWLFDRPIGKSLGFTIAEDVEVPQDSKDVWLQFVDKDGKIDERRAKALLEKGEPPYRSRLGFMTAEDFFGRYAPKKGAQA